MKANRTAAFALPDASSMAFLAVVLASFAFCYISVFSTLVSAWTHNSVYSHGFLIPLVSLYLVWTMKDTLCSLSPAPNYPLGLAVLFAGLLMQLAGHAGGIIVIQEISIIVVIAGIVLLALGRRFLRNLWFPIAYLLFMIRFWDSLTARIQYPFQQLSATIGTWLLKLWDIPAYRESIYIELPNVTLEVADVCSGVNYLISVFAMGVLLAYIFIRGWKKRALLIIGAIAISILANGFRVGLIGILSFYGVAGDLHGPYHILQAMFVSVIGFIVLFAGAWLLADHAREATAIARKAPAIGKWSAVRRPLILTAIILIAAGSYINFYRPEPHALNTGLSFFPYNIDGWQGADSSPDYPKLGAMGFDDTLSRTYASGTGAQVKIFIGYFEYQKQDRELISPKIAWLHDGAGKISVMLNDGSKVKLNRVLEKKSGKEIVFWYRLNGRTVTDRYMNKGYTTWDSVWSGRTSGALVMVSGEAVDPEFIPALFTQLREFIP